MKGENEKKAKQTLPQQMSLFSSEEIEPPVSYMQTSEENLPARKILKAHKRVFRKKLEFDMRDWLHLAKTPRKLFSKIKTQVRYSQEKRAKELSNYTVEEKKIIEEKVQESSEEVDKYKKNKHKTLKNVLFLCFNIVLVVGILLWNLLSSDDYEPLVTSGLKLEFLLVVLLLLAVAVFMDVASVHRMIFRKTLRSRWFLSYKSVVSLRYYDAVTPLASGGQAFMVSYLTSRDVPGSTALSIPISKLLFQNMAWLLITGICLVLSLTMNIGSGFVSVASWIGFCLCLLLVLFILFVSKSKTVGNKIVPACLRLLCKMHIIKNYDKAYQKSLSFVEDYQKVMSEYSRSKFDMVLQFVFHVCRTVAIFCMPFFIYCSFMGWSPEKFGEFFMFTALIDLASSFIPLPGGTGMNEITFTMLFKQYLGGYTFWALLFWRFCSYYFYLVQGLVVQAYDAMYGNKKWLWTKKKLELQEESRQFKRDQIETFRKERIKRRKSAK